MEDCWRFPDRTGPGQVPLKRLRSDFDDLAPPTSAYFPREEPRFDERDGRLAWTEPESLGMGYGPGLGGNDISTTGRLGLSGHGSLNLGRSTHDDIGLSGQGHMLGSDKASDIERNEYLPRQANPLPRTGAPGLPSSDGSTTLFVEGLPSDCSKREVAHVFRPFLGFKEVRLVRKDAKRPGGDQVVLCFVDFTDMRSAATAMEALQGDKYWNTRSQRHDRIFWFLGRRSYCPNRYITHFDYNRGKICHTSIHFIGMNEDLRRHMRHQNTSSGKIILLMKEGVGSP